MALVEAGQRSLNGRLYANHQRDPAPSSTIGVVRPSVTLRRSFDAWELDGLHRLDLDADVRITAMLDREGLVELLAAAWAALSDADLKRVQERVFSRETAPVRHMLMEQPTRDLRSI